MTPEEFVTLPSEDVVHPEYLAPEAPAEGDEAGPSVAPPDEDDTGMQEEESDGDEDSEIDVSRRRIFQVISELES